MAPKRATNESKPRQVYRRKMSRKARTQYGTEESTKGERSKSRTRLFYITCYESYYTIAYGIYVYIVTWRLWYIIFDIIRGDENYVLESFYLAHEILYACDIK